VTSIRGQLTRAYSAALIGTMSLFALAIWATRRYSAVEDVQRAVMMEASLTLNVIRQAEEAGQPVTVERDKLVGPVITPTLATLLEGMPGYVVVLDSVGRILFVSYAVRQLGSDDLAQLMSIVVTQPTTGAGQVVTIGSQSLLLIARTPEGNSQVSRVAVASSLHSADVAIRQLLGTMLVIAPLLLIASLVLAYLIAGRAFRPVDRLVNEVQAITDGRSLHRRLPVAAGEEIARLAVTVNEMLERLEKSFAALRRFTADASHELKTPLAVLRADVERAMSDNAPRVEKMVALEEALQETARMADLVESLLTLARADEGRFDLHRERIDLEPLTREVYETTSILGEAAGLQVELAEAESAIVLGDYNRLRQLFLNLATNAIKYTPRGGRVEFSLTRYEKTVTFTVRDTGVGISSADLPHIFERFYRADRARSRLAERGGFGLGLAISQWIAEAHGGTISVRSRLARGSTFTVTLPLAEQGELALTPPLPEQATA